MKKNKKIIVGLLLALIFAGCATMPTPKTTGQKIAYAKATVTGINTSIIQLLNADAITLDEAKKYRDTTGRIRILLNAADNYLSLGEQALAADSWADANQLLLEINGILLERAQRRKDE